MKIGCDGVFDRDTDKLSETSFLGKIEPNQIEEWPVPIVIPVYHHKTESLPDKQKLAFWRRDGRRGDQEGRVQTKNGVFATNNGESTFDKRKIDKGEQAS